MNRLVLIYTILSSDHTKQNACALSDLIFKNIPHKDTWPISSFKQQHWRRCPWFLLKVLMSSLQHYCFIEICLLRSRKTVKNLLKKTKKVFSSSYRRHQQIQICMRTHKHKLTVLNQHEPLLQYCNSSSTVTKRSDTLCYKFYFKTVTVKITSFLTTVRFLTGTSL